MKKIILVLGAVLCLGTVSCDSGTSGKSKEAADRSYKQVPVIPENPGLFVKKIDGLSGNFIRGVDISSVIALEKSGVQFKDYDGTVKDIFALLKENGVNYIRIRIWNDPATKDGKGYGGGNNDLKTAIEIGRRAAAYKMPVLIDFHYSDFWADPSKQMVPKAWKGMTIDKKSAALYDFTVKSLKKLLKSGVNVGMVQIGNETTGFFCGEKNWLNISKLMKAGCSAVRDVTKKEHRQIQIVIHFTNPEKSGEYMRYAQILKHNAIDYDIFASSWYPYWHGTLANLTKTLKEVAAFTGKKVMVAEFSYARTFEDGDGYPNAIAETSAVDLPYSVTVQGQADCIRDVMNAVASVGTAGLGVFYWEPAWIPVPGKTKEERQNLWDEYGSGWASKYAAEYDPSDAGKWYGGSSYDNQALFDFSGQAEPSLATFGLAAVGAKTEQQPDFAETQIVKVRLGDPVNLPETVPVKYNDSSVRNCTVIWNTTADDGSAVKELSSKGVNSYKVYGKVGNLTVLALVKAVDQNYVENPSFEEADLSMWKLTNIGNVTTELSIADKKSDAFSGKKALHFWSSQKVDFTAEQTIKNLHPGNYKLSMVIHGGDANNPTMYLYAVSDGKHYKQSTKVDGWRNFQTPTIRNIRAGSDGTIVIGAAIACDKNGWGSIDDFILAPEH
jgi:arabinogalactan endo-1,4-beta-galactosidase